VYFQVLEKNGVASGGRIIVLTDGDENVSPDVGHITNFVLQKVRFLLFFHWRLEFCYFLWRLQHRINEFGTSCIAPFSQTLCRRLGTKTKAYLVQAVTMALTLCACGASCYKRRIDLEVRSINNFRCNLEY